MRSLLVVICCLVAFLSNGKNLRIGLFEKDPVKSILVKYNIGRYGLLSESKQLGFFQGKRDKLSVKAYGDKVVVYLNNKKLGSYVWFRMNKQSKLNSLLLFPHNKEKRYRGDIVFYASKGELQVVNEVDLDEYVKGVVKGEVGYGYNKEYYKVQAVISRTYGLFLHKHKEDGFDLCDHTHCQVYKGINYDKNIDQAVNETAGEVIVDSTIGYLNTLFHSNCGGQTVTTDYVWNKKLSNLESIKDTHCRKSSQANWRRTISKDRFVRYLSNKTNRTKEYVLGKKLDFVQGYRKKYYKIGGKKIKLTKIRSYFGLKSTFFSVHDIGEKIIITGRGYGHGVGLCQEGAIAMSKKNYSYKEIIKFYYTGINVIKESERSFYLLF